MSLIKHEFFPRSMFDTDLWLRPRHHGIGSSSLDLFDPFDELDRVMSRNFRWLRRPSFLSNVIPETPRVPHKFRVTLDCLGFDPKSIKTEISKDRSKLIVTASEGERKSEEEDYILNEMKRTYELPANADTDKLVSFVTSSGKLVIEMPLKVEHLKKAGKGKASKQILSESLPKIVEDDKGNKSVQVSITLPSNIDPNKVKVTCKDRDLIIQAEEKTESKDESSSTSYYSRFTLPENTDLESLKCICDKDHLMVTAPIEKSAEHMKRTIPIEIKGNNTKKLKEN